MPLALVCKCVYSVFALYMIISFVVIMSFIIFFVQFPMMVCGIFPCESNSNDNLHAILCFLFIYSCILLSLLDLSTFVWPIQFCMFRFSPFKCLFSIRTNEMKTFFMCRCHFIPSILTWDKRCYKKKFMQETRTALHTLQQHIVKAMVIHRLQTQIVIIFNRISVCVTLLLQLFFVYAHTHTFFYTHIITKVLWFQHTVPAIESCNTIMIFF